MHRRSPNADSPLGARQDASQGDGFDFIVGVWLWPLPETGWRRYWLWSRLVKEERHVRELIREAVRQHLMFNPEQAEASANDAVRFRLTDQLGPGGMLRRRWRAMIELELPDDVKALRRDHESEMYGIEITAKATELRMERLRKSREDCERFLTAAMQSSMAQYSVRLTQSPQDVAEITKDMLDRTPRERDGTSG